MTESDELLSHAARCDRLAEACTNLAVAGKLRQLAQDYRGLAGQHDGIAITVAIQTPRSPVAA